MYGVSEARPYHAGHRDKRPQRLAVWDATHLRDLSVGLRPVCLMMWFSPLKNMDCTCLLNLKPLGHRLHIALLIEWHRYHLTVPSNAPSQVARGLPRIIEEAGWNVFKRLMLIMLCGAYITIMTTAFPRFRRNSTQRSTRNPPDISPSPLCRTSSTTVVPYMPGRTRPSALVPPSSASRDTRRGAQPGNSPLHPSPHLASTPSSPTKPLLPAHIGYLATSVSVAIVLASEALCSGGNPGPRSRACTFLVDRACWRSA